LSDQHASVNKDLSELTQKSLSNKQGIDDINATIKQVQQSI
jgi:hypothetical protein